MSVITIRGSKVLEDVPVRATVLGIEDFHYLLEAEPPEPWTVEVYRLRPESIID